MNFDTKIVKIVLVKTMLYMAVVEESLVQSRIYYNFIRTSLLPGGAEGEMYF
jgi:hypothetical protein